jgi:hypothetical protein
MQFVDVSSEEHELKYSSKRYRCGQNGCGTKVAFQICNPHNLAHTQVQYPDFLYCAVYSGCQLLPISRPAPVY